MFAAANIDRVVTLDLHNHASVGLFAMPFYHLSSVALFKPLLKNFADLLIVAPDYGGQHRAQMLATTLACDYLCIDKRNDKQEYMQVNSTLVLQGRDCVLYDDICVSGRTLLWAQELLQQQGAKNIGVLVTHALFNAGTAAQLNNKQQLFACSDSVLAATSEEIVTMPIASLLAETITALHHDHELPAGVQGYA